MLKVTCALIIQGKELLITQNSSKSDQPFQWEFPGGKIKIDEASEDCIKREIDEELGVEIEIFSTMKPITFDYGFKTIKLFPFICSIKNGKIKLTEHHDCKWIKLNELKSIDFSGADKKLIEQEQHRAILKEYIGK